MNIALINNKEDYYSCTKLIGDKYLQDYNFFTVENKPPYLIDIEIEVKNLSKWKNYGITDFNTNRFWLENYNEINFIISKYIKNISINNNYFRLGLIMSLTPDLFLPVFEFSKFVKKYNIQKIFLKNESGIMDTFFEYIKNSGIQTGLYL